MLKKVLYVGLLLYTSVAIGCTRERLKREMAQRIALRSVTMSQQMRTEESKGRPDSCITITLPASKTTVSKEEVKILVKQALLNKGIEVQAKSLSVSLRNLIDMGADYNKSHSHADKIRFSFAVKNSWADAFLFFLLLRQRKISKELFCDVYLKPLQAKTTNELSTLANQLSRGIVTVESIGATLYLFYHTIELYYNNRPKTMHSFIDEINKEIDSCKYLLQEVIATRNLHHILSEKTPTNIENLKKFFKKYGPQLFGKKDMYGYFPVHYAAFFNNMPALQFLFGSGCSANVSNDEGMLPLLLASDAKVIEFIKSKTDINTQFAGGKTALLIACQNNSICKARLAAFKARVDVCDDQGNMPMHFFVDREIKKYVSVDPRNMLVAKVKAAKSGNLEALDKAFNIEKMLNINIDNMQALEEAKKQLAIAHNKHNKPRAEWMKIVIKALEQAESGTLKNIFSSIELAVEACLKSNEAKKIENSQKEKSGPTLVQSTQSINASTIVPALLENAQSSIAIIQAQSDTSDKPKKLSGTQRKKLKKLAQQQEQERIVQLKQQDKEEKKKLWEQEQAMNKQADDFAQAHTKKRVFGAWQHYAHDKTQTLTKLEKQAQNSLESSQKKNLFIRWREELAKKKEIKKKQGATKIAQQKLADQQAVEHYSQELIACQSRQEMHNIPADPGAHEWWLQHVNAICTTLNAACTSVLDSDPYIILQGACHTCAQNNLIVLDPAVRLYKDSQFRVLSQHKL